MQGYVVCNVFRNTLLITALYNKVEYFVKINFSGLLVAKTYLNSNLVI